MPCGLPHTTYSLIGYRRSSGPLARFWRQRGASVVPAAVLRFAGSCRAVDRNMVLRQAGRRPAAEHPAIDCRFGRAAGVARDIRHGLGRPSESADSASLVKALVAAAPCARFSPRAICSRSSALVNQQDEPLRVAAIEAAGQWRLEAARESINQLASAGDSSDTVAARLSAPWRHLDPRAPDALCVAGHDRPARRVCWRWPPWRPWM